jgi:hypothetical protein
VADQHAARMLGARELAHLVPDVELALRRGRYLGEVLAVHLEPQALRALVVGVELALGEGDGFGHWHHFLRNA